MQLSRLGVAGGHAGRSRDAKPGTSHREEVTAILHAAINLCSLTLLLFYSERKGLRHVYVYAKCGDVKKRRSRHASRAKIVASLSFSTYAFNCRRAQLREEAWFRGYVRTYVARRGANENNIEIFTRKKVICNDVIEVR